MINPKFVTECVNQIVSSAAMIRSVVTVHLVVSVGSFICIPYPCDTHTIISDLVKTVNTPFYGV